MADGDVNSRQVISLGEWKILTGTMEVSDTAQPIAIADSNCYILACVLTNQDGASAIQCMPNSSDGTADTLNGSVYVDNSAAQTDTVQFVAIIRGP